MACSQTTLLSMVLYVLFVVRLLSIGRRREVTCVRFGGLCGGVHVYFSFVSEQRSEVKSYFHSSKNHLTVGCG